MAKRYARVNWQNSPSTTTPLNADNLNKMDKGIDDLDNAIEELNNNLAIQSGSWTPAIIGTSGTPTYTTQLGRYYRIGKMCFIEGYIKLSAKNDLSGGIGIVGLPFATISGEPRGCVTIGAVAGLNYSNYKQVFAVFNPASTGITPYFVSDGTSVALVNASAITDSFEIRIGGVYRLP